MKNLIGPNDWRIDDESGPADSAPDRNRVRDGDGRLRRQEAAGRPPDASAAADVGHEPVAPAGAARARLGADDRSARTGARRRDLVGVARRAEQELAAEAGVLR